MFFGVLEQKTKWERQRATVADSSYHREPIMSYVFSTSKIFKKQKNKIKNKRIIFYDIYILILKFDEFL